MVLAYDKTMKTINENTTDAIVMELLKKVELKKLQIGNAERPSWKTNCSFPIDSESNPNLRRNIQTAQLQELVFMHALLTSKYTAYKSSLVALKLDEKDVPFLWGNFSYGDWVSDIQTRINGLCIKIKRDELSALEAKVNALVSPEQRRAIELEKLVKEIGD